MKTLRFPSITAALSASAAASEKESSTRVNNVSQLEELVASANNDLAELYAALTVSTNTVRKELLSTISAPTSSIPEGLATTERIKFADYEIEQFPWFNLSKGYNVVGCGYVLLAQLTGSNPIEIKSLLSPILKEYLSRPENKHLKFLEACSHNGLPAEIMLGFLKIHGIDFKRVTAKDLCPRPSVIENLVREQHILLVALRVALNESTWGIIYQGRLFHGTDSPIELTAYDMINNPIHEMYLLHNPVWKLGKIPI
jgi:hypothetical protein